MTSFEAKKRLLMYTDAFSTPYMGGVWESANLWNADFLAVKWDSKITEFEIKVSLADLRGEVAAIREALKPGTIQEQTNMFGTRKRVRADIKLSHTKIEKHHHYLLEHKTPDMRPTAPPLFYPNIFYFAVPNELVTHAAALLKGLPYGVFDLDALEVVVKAKTIRTEPHNAGTFIHLFNRSCVIRRDMENQLIGARSAVLEQVAVAYKLEPGSPGYMRLMRVGREDLEK
jgi:hypothetical protein